MRGERQGPRLCVPPSRLNAPPRCGQRREAGAQWWGPTRLHPGWVPEADGSLDPSTEGIHKDTDGPDQASDGVKYFAHLPGLFLVLAGFGVPALGRVTALTSSLAASFPGKDTDVFREEVPEKAAPS